MQVVVTGGAGFIGSNLARTLRAADWVQDVVVVDDLSTGSRMNLEEVDVTFHEGSILDPRALDIAFEGSDAVVHLAARPSVTRSIDDPLATHHTNATGTLQVLEAARRAGNVYTVLASSSSVYGSNPQLPKHEDLRPQPMSPYAVSKLAAEQYALAWAACFGLPVLPFRFFNVFGPFQPAGHAYAAAVPAFISAAILGDPVRIFGDGKQTRDFTYVGSVCKMIAEAVRRRVTADEPVNLAFGSRRSLLEVIAGIELLLDREITRDHQPPRKGDVRHSQADSTRLRNLFPDIDPVPFEDGLRATIEWLQAAA